MLPEARDSLMELVIWSHPKPIDHFIQLGFEKYYSTKPKVNRAEINNLIWSKTKHYIKKYGYPTIEKVGSEWIMTMTFLTIAHRPALEDLILFKDEMQGIILPRRMALLEDKISVALGQDQLYGTQIQSKFIDDQRLFYPIRDIASIDSRRMKVGLQPFSSYAKQYGVRLPLGYEK